MSGRHPSSTGLRQALEVSIDDVNHAPHLSIQRFTRARQRANRPWSTLGCGTLTSPSTLTAGECSPNLSRWISGRRGSASRDLERHLVEQRGGLLPAVAAASEAAQHGQAQRAGAARDHHGELPFERRGVEAPLAGDDRLHAATGAGEVEQFEETLAA